MVASLSNGSLCVVSPVDGSHFALTDSWHAHDHEPWAAAWDYWNANILFSGALNFLYSGNCPVESIKAVMISR